MVIEYLQMNPIGFFQEAQTALAIVLGLNLIPEGTRQRQPDPRPFPNLRRVSVTGGKGDTL